MSEDSGIKSTLIWILIWFVVGGFVGWLISDKFNNPDGNIQVREPSPGPVIQTDVPDSIWKIIDSLKTKSEKPPEIKWERKIVYQDTGESRIDTVYVQENDFTEIYVSHKHFEPTEFNKVDVWAFAPVEVDSLRIKSEVEWNRYYNTLVRPDVEKMIKEQNRNSLMKGIIGTAVAAGGIMTRDKYAAIGGLVVGTGIILLW